MPQALDAVFQPNRALPAASRLLLHAPDGPADATVAARLGFRTVEATTARLAVVGDGAVRIADAPVLSVALADALPVLLRSRRSAVVASDSVRGWGHATGLALALTVSQRIAPRLSRIPDAHVHATWQVRPEADPAAAAALDALAAALPAAATALAVGDERVWRAEALLAAFCDAVADLAVRSAAPPERSDRPRARLLPWTARWAAALGDAADPTVPLGDDVEEIVAGVESWERDATRGPGDSLELALEPPTEPSERWRVTFRLRTAEGTVLAPPAVWSAADGPEAEGRREALLTNLARVADLYPPLDAALGDAEPSGVTVDVDQAWEFLHLAVPLLREAGVPVEVPDDLDADALSVLVELDHDELDDVDESPTAEPGGAVVGDTELRLTVTAGGRTLAPEELERLADAGRPLVFLDGRWLRLDPERARRLASLPAEGKLGAGDALALGLSGSARLGDLADRFEDAGDVDWSALAEETATVATGGAVGALIERLHATREQPPVPAVPDGFSGELRPYQRRGVAWLQAMEGLGLGGVLADDMGLGKGIQLIAYLCGRAARVDGAGPWLIVCPTSVVGNWARELARFAPHLAVTRHHGAERPDDLRAIEGVVLTSYGTLRRDVDVLAAVPWDIVTLDEAQHVKNPSTAGARAVRRLQAKQVLALTGTPLENRLIELWSVLDAVNRGLFGSRGVFARRFSAPVERGNDPGAARRLRSLVSPFVLRREKRDPEIVGDLPAKTERTVVCDLTDEQARAYQAAVARVLDGEGLGAGMGRRGRILALLTELKQICNHPEQRAAASGDTTPAEPGRLAERSGKLAVLGELVAEATAGDEQVLVFTQYVAMGWLLVAQLSADLDTTVPFLHGGLTGAQRDRMVADFQGEGPETPAPVFVVSLRAGGTGLNLTAATQVVHYDRWWNPAVEDQATDRTHRIGQDRPVSVHKLVTAGTVEERIAELVDAKRELADTVVAAGETWVTELGDEDLRALVELSADAPVTGPDLEGSTAS